MRALLLLASIDVAYADPCADVIEDPVATPLHGGDSQRGACLRSELSASVNSHALIDTPNFHGVLGGDMTVAARFVTRKRAGAWLFSGVSELGVALRVVDFQFAQTAVNKATETGVGPLVLSAAMPIPFADTARLALVAIGEVPYTRSSERETWRLAGQLVLAFTGELGATWRLHARMGYVFSSVQSDGGTTNRIAPRAGFDLAWHPKRRWAFVAGTDAEAGWRDGFSTLLVRGGISWRPRGGAYRLQLAGAAPLGGDEPTTAIAYLGLARDL
jgi:hypothetical protein